MTEKTKSHIRQAGWVALGGVAASLSFWLFLQIVSYSYGFSGLMSVPKEVNDVKIRQNKLDSTSKNYYTKFNKTDDSIINAIKIHEAVQTIQFKSIDEKLDILIGTKKLNGFAETTKKIFNPGSKQ